MEKTKYLKSRISLSLTRNRTASGSSKQKKSKLFNIHDKESSSSQISSLSISSTVTNSFNDSKNLSKTINNDASISNKMNNIKTLLSPVNSIIKYDDLNSLNKLMNNFTKSLSYFEQIIKNKKIDIISSCVTSILELIIELYNLTQNFNFQNLKPNDKNLTTNDEYNRNEENNKAAMSMYRSNINESLANLLKWSDKIFYSSYDEFNYDYNYVDALIKNLDNCIKQFVSHYKNYYFPISKFKKQRKTNNVYLVSKSLSPFSHRSFISRSSSLSVPSDNQIKEELLSKNSQTISRKQKTFIDKKSELSKNVNHSTQDNAQQVEKIHKTFNKYGHKFPLTHTSVFSKSSNKLDKKRCNSMQNAFCACNGFQNSSQLISDALQQASILNNLDKLVLELSESSSSNSSFNRNKSFDDELCTKLIPRFEKIIKEYNNNVKLKEPKFSLSSNHN
jgi:hypothetical protein